MKSVVILTARAFVDTFCSSLQCDCEKLADTALRHLKSCGCTLRDMRAFLKAVGNELRKRGFAASVQLTTPTGKSGTQRDAIAKALERALGSSLELQEQADPLLIGGATIAYGDERFDHSLRGVLTKLRAHLATT